MIVVDHLPDRLDRARQAHAEVVNFDSDDPVATIVELTGGVGVDRVIDAVGVDAQSPGGGRQTPSSDGQWVPGDAPGQALRWAVDAVAKAGTISVIGVYPPGMESFPIGTVMNRNLTVNAGNCNHRHYIPELLKLTASGVIDPATILTEQLPMADVIEAYREFDRREPGWLKVAFNPAG